MRLDDFFSTDFFLSEIIIKNIFKFYFFVALNNYFIKIRSRIINLLP